MKNEKNKNFYSNPNVLFLSTFPICYKKSLTYTTLRTAFVNPSLNLKVIAAGVELFDEMGLEDVKFDFFDRNLSKRSLDSFFSF